MSRRSSRHGGHGTTSGPIAQEEKRTHISIEDGLAEKKYLKDALGVVSSFVLITDLCCGAECKYQGNECPCLEIRGKEKVLVEDANDPNQALIAHRLCNPCVEVGEEQAAKDLSLNLERTFDCAVTQPGIYVRTIDTTLKGAKWTLGSRLTEEETLQFHETYTADEQWEMIRPLELRRLARDSQVWPSRETFGRGVIDVVQEWFETELYGRERMLIAASNPKNVAEARAFVGKSEVLVEKLAQATQKGEREGKVLYEEAREIIATLYPELDRNLVKYGVGASGTPEQRAKESMDLTYSAIQFAEQVVRAADAVEGRDGMVDANGNVMSPVSPGLESLAIGNATADASLLARASMSDAERNADHFSGKGQQKTLQDRATAKRRLREGTLAFSPKGPDPVTLRPRVDGRGESPHRNNDRGSGQRGSQGDEEMRRWLSQGGRVQGYSGGAGGLGGSTGTISPISATIRQLESDLTNVSLGSPQVDTFLVPVGEPIHEHTEGEATSDKPSRRGNRFWPVVDATGRSIKGGGAVVFTNERESRKCWAGFDCQHQGFKRLTDVRKYLVKWGTDVNKFGKGAALIPGKRYPMVQATGARMPGQREAVVVAEPATKIFTMVTADVEPNDQFSMLQANIYLDQNLLANDEQEFLRAHGGSRAGLNIVEHATMDHAINLLRTSGFHDVHVVPDHTHTHNNERTYMRIRYVSEREDKTYVTNNRRILYALDDVRAVQGARVAKMSEERVTPPMSHVQEGVASSTHLPTAVHNAHADEVSVLSMRLELAREERLKTEAARDLVKMELELAKARVVAPTTNTGVVPGVAGTVSPGGEVEYLAAENKALKQELQQAKAAIEPGTTAAETEAQHDGYRREARLKEAIWVFPETGVEDTSQGQVGVVRIDNHSGNPEVYSSPSHNPQHLDLGLSYLKQIGLIMGFFHLEPVEALGLKIIKGMVDHARGAFNVWEVNGTNMDLHWLKAEVGKEFVKTYMRCQARLERARTLYLGTSGGMRTPEEQRYLEVGLEFLGLSKPEWCVMEQRGDEGCHGAEVEAVGARVLRLIAFEHGPILKWSTETKMDGSKVKDDLDLECIPSQVCCALLSTYQNACEDGNVQLIVDFDPDEGGPCSFCHARGSDDRHDMGTCPELSAARSGGDKVVVHSPKPQGGAREPAVDGALTQVANTNDTAIDLSKSPNGQVKQEGIPLCTLRTRNQVQSNEALLARIDQLEFEAAGHAAEMDRVQGTETQAPVAPTEGGEGMDEEEEETKNKNTKKGDENTEAGEDSAEEEEKEEKEEDAEVEGCKSEVPSKPDDRDPDADTPYVAGAPAPTADQARAARGKLFREERDSLRLQLAEARTIAKDADARHRTLEDRHLKLAEARTSAARAVPTADEVKAAVLAKDAAKEREERLQECRDASNAIERRITEEVTRTEQEEAQTVIGADDGAQETTHPFFLLQSGNRAVALAAARHRGHTAITVEGVQYTQYATQLPAQEQTLVINIPSPEVERQVALALETNPVVDSPSSTVSKRRVSTVVTPLVNPVASAFTQSERAAGGTQGVRSYAKGVDHLAEVYAGLEGEDANPEMAFEASTDPMGTPSSAGLEGAIEDALPPVLAPTTGAAASIPLPARRCVTMADWHASSPTKSKTISRGGKGYLHQNSPAKQESLEQAFAKAAKSKVALGANTGQDTPLMLELSQDRSDRSQSVDVSTDSRPSALDYSVEHDDSSPRAPTRQVVHEPTDEKFRTELRLAEAQATTERLKIEALKLQQQVEREQRDEKGVELQDAIATVPCAQRALEAAQTANDATAIATAKAWIAKIQLTTDLVRASGKGTTEGAHGSDAKKPVGVASRVLYQDGNGNLVVTPKLAPIPVAAPGTPMDDVLPSGAEAIMLKLLQEEQSSVGRALPTEEVSPDVTATCVEGIDAACVKVAMVASDTSSGGATGQKELRDMMPAVSPEVATPVGVTRSDVAEMVSNSMVAMTQKMEHSFKTLLTEAMSPAPGGKKGRNKKKSGSGAGAGDSSSGTSSASNTDDDELDGDVWATDYGQGRYIGKAKNEAGIYKMKGRQKVVAQLGHEFLGNENGKNLLEMIEGALHKPNEAHEIDAMLKGLDDFFTDPRKMKKLYASSTKDMKGWNNFMEKVESEFKYGHRQLMRSDGGKFEWLTKLKKKKTAVQSMLTGESKAASAFGRMYYLIKSIDSFVQKHFLKGITDDVLRYVRATIWTDLREVEKECYFSRPAVMYRQVMVLAEFVNDGCIVPEEMWRHNLYGRMVSTIVHADSVSTDERLDALERRGQQSSSAAQQSFGAASASDKYGNAAILPIVRTHETDLKGKAYMNTKGAPYFGSICDFCEDQGSGSYHHHPLRCNKAHPMWKTTPPETLNPNVSWFVRGGGKANLTGK